MVLPSLVAVIHSMVIAAFIVGSICVALVGSCRYVETLTRCIYMVPLTHASAQIGSRGDTRDRYGIRGGTCGDCLSAWCCRPCALTQERREIELEEHSF
jgi:Cys-rich protein (TIGR01571 family)